MHQNSRSETITYSFSVIICAHSEERFDDLCEAIASINHQTYQPMELIVAIDHNPALEDHVRQHIADANYAIETHVIGNSDERGLSGARNSAIKIARGDILAFIDDDAVAEADWLAHLMACYVSENVVGAGGKLIPDWLAGKPAWFPEEFNWVVGCSYKGLPTRKSSIRNLIGANMSYRREVFESVGMFRTGVGRVDSLPVGCEETELCIRVRQFSDQAVFIFEPAAIVHHKVPAKRSTFHYFRSRCYFEGRSKALIARHIGTEDALSSERSYTTKVLPAGVMRGFLDIFRLDFNGFRRSIAIIIGFVMTVMGYLRGEITSGEMDEQREKNWQRSDDQPAVATASVAPIKVMTVNLNQPIPELPLELSGDDKTPYRSAHMLLTLFSQPIKQIQLAMSDTGYTSEALAAYIWKEEHALINQKMQENALPPLETLPVGGIPATGAGKVEQDRATLLENTPLISIVTATRNRPDSVKRLIESLLKLTYPNYEIIVIDNAPSDDATHNVIHNDYANQPHIHYAHVPVPGLSRARNHGIQMAKGTYIAFVDDDLEVSPEWLTGIYRGFMSGENVACVTSLVLPAELETEPQIWFEQYAGGFSRGFQSKLYDMKENRPSRPYFYPFLPGIFGTGASMAFRRDVFETIGHFDTALGPPNPSKGGEDLDMFFRVIFHGFQLVYEPSAMVRHYHRRDYESLQKQIIGYGRGSAARMTRWFVHYPSILPTFLIKLPLIPYAVLMNPSPETTERRKTITTYPPELVQLQRQNILKGPWLYFKSRRMQANLESEHAGVAITNQESVQGIK